MTTVLYRVELIGSETLGSPVDLETALDQIKRRAPREREGALRVVRVTYGLDPLDCPDPRSPAAVKVWRGMIEHFPDVGTAGQYVFKPNSQHAARFRGACVGNAQDWQAPPSANTNAEIIEYLWEVFDYSRHAGTDFERSDGKEGLPISETIFRDSIATRAYGWTVRLYGGIFHATHVHTSDYPLLPECA